MIGSSGPATILINFLLIESSMPGQTVKILIFGILGLFGIALIIPTSFFSLVLTGVAVLGIAAVLLTSVFR